MLKEERQAFIIHQINLHNKVLSSDLSIQLNVSEDTIRRDLNELAENGKVLKVYGGALSKSFQFPFQDGNVYAKEAKKEIAKKAITLLQNGMTILAGGGTTMIELARLVPDSLQCTIFTISPLVALELAEKPIVQIATSALTILSAEPLTSTYDPWREKLLAAKKNATENNTTPIAIIIKLIFKKQITHLSI